MITVKDGFFITNEENTSGVYTTRDVYGESIIIEGCTFHGMNFPPTISISLFGINIPTPRRLIIAYRAARWAWDKSKGVS